MLSRFFRKRAAPLTGAPAVRRQKAYSAQTGYVYQYFYEGHRASASDPGQEYVFDVSADRKTSIHVSVFVGEEALANWEQQRGRTLSASEQYAVAKMALFQAFDARENPAALKDPVHVRAADVHAILSLLDID